MVRVTHRFHPWFGRSFPFVKRTKGWQADRVHVIDDAGALVCLPAEWTDQVPEDPFVVIAAGRSPFRTQDLLELAVLVEQLAGGGEGVQKILP